MTDIVNRLRLLVPSDPSGASIDAINEIARLRAGGCARDQGTTQYCAEAAKLAAENEKLRAALEWIAGTALTEAEAMAEKARAALDYRKMEGRT